MKMLFSKYTEMMNKSNKANKWENSVTYQQLRKFTVHTVTNDGEN
jgi:hypothetical protein